MMSSSLKLKVQSVKAVRDHENREGFQIDFVEIRPRPPMVMVTPTEVPEEISQMMVQISRGVRQALPGGDAREIEIMKLTLIITSEELESFKLRPYPNQLYELTISEGSLRFQEIQ